MFTESTTFWVMETIRLDLGYGSHVHPDDRHPYQGRHMSVATKPRDPIGDFPREVEVLENGKATVLDCPWGKETRSWL